jgi:hypothetical protein
MYSGFSKRVGYDLVDKNPTTGIYHQANEQQVSSNNVRKE